MFAAEFCAGATGREASGLVSSLGACDDEFDRFFILDMSHCKCPPVRAWTNVLFDAMNTVVSGNEDMTRGYVSIGR